MNIHERARKLAAQAAHPMEMSAAYSELSRRGAKKRRARYGNTTVKADAFTNVETPKYRFPYAND
jgi:hypothetical protein